MAADLGVHVKEIASSAITPVAAESGLPYVVGIAPVQSASDPAAACVPVLVESWEDALEKLGFSYDWNTYKGVCEFMYSHFILYGRKPVIFYNALNPSTMKESVASAAVSVTSHKANLPYGAIHSSIVVKDAASGDSAHTLEEDVDYTITYDYEANSNAGYCVVELLSSGSYYSLVTLYIAYDKVDVSQVTTAKIVEGISAIDQCMTTVSMVPDLILAPGFSENDTIAAMMATKAKSINNLFTAKAIIDVDCTVSGVTSRSGLATYKTEHVLNMEEEIVCWPQVKYGDFQFHMSTHLAGLIAQVDTNNNGVPYESPSNKNFMIASTVLADGTAVRLSFEDSVAIANIGFVTSINWMTSGFTCRNNYTACWPDDKSAQNCFIPVSRMFGWIGNTMIRTFWSQLDRPMTRRLVGAILDTCNVWLNGLVGAEYLLGGRAEMHDDENPVSDLEQGILRIHLYITPPSPAQEIDFLLEYDHNYVAEAFASE